MNESAPRNPRRCLAVVIPAFLLLMSIPTGGAQPQVGLAARQLTLAERIAAQEAIERVYYRHQIGATMPFDEAVPRDVVERKVRDTLKKSEALERLWDTPVTSDMLRAETDRIARATRWPDRLREVQAALGNDSLLVQECFARPVLVDRLVRGFFSGEENVRGQAGLHGASARDSESWDSWWQRSRDQFDERRVQTVAAPGSLDTQALAPGTASSGCVPDDTWDNGILDDAPAARRSPASVWTGSLLLIWGGAIDGPGDTKTGLRYDPLTDTWSSTSTVNAPAALHFLTAVWTGSEMIVWGQAGQTPTAGGGRYDPVTDSWSFVSTQGGPLIWQSAPSVWTGSRLVVWGGYPNFSAGRYDPKTDTWAPVSSANAPAARSFHTAIWTGSEMIVWGGYGGASLGNGGRYNPQTDVWAPISMANAPSRRSTHTAVWTGTRMVIWGGGGDLGLQGNGARYDPGTDSWSAVSASSAPTPRQSHSAVWTGTEMIVWGGYDGSSTVTATGGRYNPASDTWSGVGTAGAPTARGSHIAVWTGSRMLVWGGFTATTVPLNTGGRYDPAANIWTPTSIGSGPGPRLGHSAVWTGTQMIVWGGVFDVANGPVLDTGGRYDPLTDSWIGMSTTGAPERRRDHTAVWTGSQMIVWGGESLTATLNTGARYDPTSDSWSSMATGGSPGSRSTHTAVWTGLQMIVWGGSADFGHTGVADGGRYDPLANNWSAMTSTNAPTARFDHSAVWAGTDMIVFGGTNTSGGNLFNDGARYSPATDQWIATSTAGAPGGRRRHTALWTGSEMVIWGGEILFSSSTNTGGRYSPVTDTWTDMTLINAPPGRRFHSAVWTGSEMVVWGGQKGSLVYDSGGRYAPATDTWASITTAGAPVGRNAHTAVWTGTFMMVWGGIGPSTLPVDGGRYRAGQTPDNDGDGFLACEDCNDSDATVHPGAVEICDHVDNNCNGVVDEGLDLDSDGVADCSDNCPLAANPGQQDADGDQAGDACDCRPTDASAFAQPVEVTGVTFGANGSLLTWNSSVPASGAGTVHQILRGLTQDLPVGSGPSETCLASGETGASLTDAEAPPLDAAFWYLVRGVNACDRGTYGFASTGTERTSPSCP